jgi:hypothetical protein
MRERLDEALALLGRPSAYTFLEADTLPPSDPRRFYGTPTILLGGTDLFGMPAPTAGPHVRFDGTIRAEFRPSLRLPSNYKNTTGPRPVPQSARNVWPWLTKTPTFCRAKWTLQVPPLDIITQVVY